MSANQAVKKPGPRGQIWYGVEEVPPLLTNTVVAVGNFDGFHLGHQALINEMNRYALAHDLLSAVITFNPHPRHIFIGRRRLPLITSYKYRNELLLAAGLDAVLDIEFTKEFADITPEQFVEKILVQTLKVKAIVMGQDSRFGKNNAGDIATMQRLGSQLGFEVINVDDLMQPGCTTQKVSSSAIRESILLGAVEQAAQMLNRYHSLSDVVQHGYKRGRELGFPTANFSTEPQGLIPADGIYAGFFTVLDATAAEINTPGASSCVSRQPATISIGTNPTFEDGPDERVVETYVHGSHEYDFYGRQVRIEFVKKLRDTIAFEDVGQLVAQMHKDVAVTRDTLNALQEPKMSLA